MVLLGGFGVNICREGARQYKLQKAYEQTLMQRGTASMLMQATSEMINKCLADSFGSLFYLPVLWNNP
jgi:hypothetical protein